MLTDAQVSVDTGITGSTSQVLVLTVRDMEVSLGVTVLLGETKVDHVDLIATFANAHQKVVRLDITVDEGLGVDVLDARNELVCQEKNSLQGEFAVAEVEEILQARSKEIHHHGVVVTLGSIPADKGNPNSSSKRLVDTSFIFELRVFGLDTLKLDGNFFTGDDIGALRLLGNLGQKAQNTHLPR